MKKLILAGVLFGIAIVGVSQYSVNATHEMGPDPHITIAAQDVGPNPHVIANTDV